MKNKAFIGLGSNMGDRYQTLIEAIQSLSRHPKIQVVNSSSIYETDPVGYEEQELFLNMVIAIETDLDAEELLEICMSVEKEFGRKREIRWGPRTIDLDILTFNQENVKTEKLIVPHPRMLERAFVMIPLLEVCHGIDTLELKQQLLLHLDQLPNTEGVRLWKRKSGEGVFVPIES